MLKNLKLVLLTLACAALVSLAISGTLADTNSGVIFSLKQHEQERRIQSQQYVLNDNLVPFTNRHLLVPSNQDTATYAQIPQQWDDGSSDALFADSMKNVIDKIVTVENDGTATAYVRTWFAFEQGDLSRSELESSIILNLNSQDWTWVTVADGISIEGNTYLIMCATYNTALEAGQTSSPSLMQLAMARSAGHLTESIDANKDGVYNVLVTSEAYSDNRAMPAPTQELIPWNK